MNTKTTKKIQEQFTDAVKNPQEFATNLNEKHQEFSHEVQSILLSLPQEMLNQQKEFQEKASILASRVQELVTKKPVDFVQLQQTLLQYQTESFAAQAKLIQDNVKRTQELFKIYTK